MEYTPPISLHHVALRVSDLDRSVLWYTRELGFSVIRRGLVDGAPSAVLDNDGVQINLVQHPDRGAGPGFLDHLSFGVEGRAALDEWVARFDRIGIVHSDVVSAGFGDLVSLVDPDGITLEFYAEG